MLNKRLMMLAIILVGLLAVSAVSAADNATEDVVGIEMTDDTVVNAADEVAIADDIQEVELDDGLMACATDETPQSFGNDTIFQGKFSELINEIGSGGNITLAKFNYEYDSGDTIEITKSGVIDGRGFTVIDMRNSNIQVFKVSAENVTFKGITFRYINYTDHGGGIYFDAANGTVENCLFEDNCALVGSSIFFNDDYGTVVDCTFKNNAASNRGGAIFDNGAYLSLINCKFIANTAFNDGGAVCIGRYSTIRNCNFKDSSAEYGGAVQLGQGGSLIDCNFTNNRASARGGAVYVFVLKCEIDNCIFTDNFASTEGGALYLGDIATVANSIFIGNNASEGGAIQFSREANVIGCNFNHNYAVYGGAMSFWDSGSVNVCNFADNSAENEGGAIYFDFGDCNVNNCNFTGNSASDGGAISGGAVYDSTFRGNSADNGGALFEAYYLDCIFINNSAQQGPDAYFSSYIRCSNVTSFYNAPDFMVISLVDSSNRPIKNVNISVNLNGVNDFITDANGQVKVSTAGLIPNEYVAEISFAGSGDYGPASANASVTILKAPSKLTASSIVAVYNTENFLVASLKYENGTAIEGVNVTVNFNGDVLNLTTDANGQVNVSTAGLNPNTYEAVFSFAGNDCINGSSASANVTVNKMAAIWAASSISTAYNTEKFLVASLKYGDGTPIAGVNVIVKFNGATLSFVTDPSGKVRVSSAGLAPKTYSATFSFAGTDFIAESSATAKVTVNKIASKLTASSITVVYNIEKTLVATLKGADGNIIKGSVNLKLSNGYTKTLTADKNGQVKFSIPANWVAKSYTATIKFAGNTYYAPVSKSVTVTVKKDSTKLVASNKAFTLKATKKVTAILKDSKNRIIKNRYVTFKVAGATYKVKTDYRGVATATVKIAKKGSFSTAVSFAGDNYYLKCSKAIKVTVK